MLIGVDASRAFLLQRTGTENYTWQLLLALAKLECEHSFRVYTKASSKFPAFGGAGTVQSSKFEEKTINWEYLWTQGGLALETWRRPVDALFIPAHVIPFLKNPRVPTIVTVHDLGFEFLPWYQNPIQRFYLSKIIEKLRSRSATHIIAVSKSTKKDLIEKLGVPEGKISVVYEGTDRRFAPELKIKSEKLKIIKKKYKIDGEYILFVGTIQPRKNLVRLIEAFARVLGEIRDSPGPGPEDFLRAGIFSSRISRANLQLVLVGKRGWSADEIYEAPKQFGVADKIKFLDYVSDEDLSALYTGALCFCLPSLHEGFGLPVLEAMASGVPVVISNVSSLPEVGGDAAVYVDPYNVNSIADGLSQLLTADITSYNQLVERGLKQVQKFSWEKCARETMEVFEKITPKNPKM